MTEIAAADAQRVAESCLDWDKLTDAAVVVTGAGGFLGSALVEALLARHRLSGGRQPGKLIAVVRNAERARSRLGSQDGLEFFEQDLSEHILGFPAFSFLIHAASQASPRFYGTDPVGTMLPNILATQSLLELGREAKGFLFVSSSEVYGQMPPDQVPTREDDYGFLDPTAVRSCYAESKRAGESLCVSHAHQFGAAAKIARVFHTYGPGIDLNDGRVFADFVRNIVQGEDIVLLSEGTARRAFCYVSDAVEGLLRILLDGESGRAYNVGNPDGEISMASLAELLVGLFPDRGLSVQRRQREEGDYVSSPVSRSSPDVRRLRALGWSPRVDLSTGFRRTVAGVEALH